MAKRKYDEEKIRAIANAIRFKNNSSDTYNTSKMSIALSGFPYTNLPNYVYNEVSRVVHDVLQFKRSHPNSLIFGMSSDFHVVLDTENTTSAKNSIRHNEAALDLIGKLLDVDFLVYGGDYAEGNVVSQETEYASSALYTESYLEKFYLVGNHDKSEVTQDLFDLIGTRNEFDDHGLTQIRGYGYRDFTDKRVRVIFLNTCDYLNASGGHGMSYEQKDWLMRSLDISDRDNWQILVVSHIPIDFTGGDYNIYSDLKTIFESYINGEVASITVNSDYALNEDPTKYITYSSSDKTLRYDYSGKNHTPIIANIHGHLHSNAYGKAYSKILRMCVPPAGYYNGDANRYSTNGDYGITWAHELVKVQNTEKDTALTVFCIDLSKQIVYAYTYGANFYVDEENNAVTYKAISYSDKVLYNATYNLNNVTSSNNSMSLEENTSYSSILTAIDPHKLKSVVITMGGVDITSQVYSDGEINIDKVTGDIIVTAIAMAYTNLFDPAYVIAPSKLNSDGSCTEGNNSCWVLTTYLPASEGDIVRIYTPNSSWRDFRQRAICCYDADKVLLKNNGDIYPMKDTDTVATGVTLSDDSLTMTTTVPAGTSYIRVSGMPYKDYGNVIVTINEDIIF